MRYTETFLNGTREIVDVTEMTFIRTVPGSGVEVKHPEWEMFLAQLAREAGHYLGLGTVKLTTRLQNLLLWEKDSMWRDYHK